MTLAQYNAWYAQQLRKIDTWFLTRPDYIPPQFVAHSLRYEPPAT